MNFLALLMENEDVASRVLCALAFGSALGEEIKLEEQTDIMGQICVVLSLHKITDESHTLLAAQLERFRQSWNVLKK